MSDADQQTRPALFPNIRSRLASRIPINGIALLLLPVTVFLLVFFAYPLGIIFWRSVAEPDWGFGQYIDLLYDGVTVRILLRTLLMTIIVTSVTLLLAYPYAYLLTIVSARKRRLLILIVLVPYWTSLMARTFAWYVLEQQGGVIHLLMQSIGIDLVLLGTTTGVVVAMIQIMLPFMVLPLYSGLAGIDLSLLQAGKSLGASPIRAFRDIYFPLSIPAILAGTSLVFILTLGFYVTPALLGSSQQAMISQIIAIRVNDLLDFPGAGALGLVLFVITLCVLYIITKVGGAFAVSGTKPSADDAK